MNIRGGVNVNSIEKIIVNVAAFLSGCFPIALIEWLRVIIFRSDSNNWYVEIFSKVFLIITVICICIFTWSIFKIFRRVNTPGNISNLKRKDTFSSGAISYYVLPFVSFVGNDINSMVTLAVVIVFLSVIFNNNMMFMYTPVLDFLGYKVLEGDLESGGNIYKTVTILVKTDKCLYFTGSNNGEFEKVQEGLYFFVNES